MTSWLTGSGSPRTAPAWRRPASTRWPVGRCGSVPSVLLLFRLRSHQQAVPLILAVLVVAGDVVPGFQVPLVVAEHPLRVLQQGLGVPPAAVPGHRVVAGLELDDHPVHFAQAVTEPALDREPGGDPGRSPVGALGPVEPLSQKAAHGRCGRGAHSSYPFIAGKAARTTS